MLKDKPHPPWALLPLLGLACFVANGTLVLTGSIILCLGAESDGANQTLLILRSTEILKGELKCKSYSVLYLFWSGLGLNNYFLTGILSVF